MTGPNLEALNWSQGRSGRGGQRWWWVGVDAANQHRSGNLQCSEWGQGAKVRGCESWVRGLQ